MALTTRTAGRSLAPAVYDWIAEAWNGKRSARDGAIVFTDASLQRRKALAFEAALITAVTFPTQDGSSKDPCYLTVTIQPEGLGIRRLDSEKIEASKDAVARVVADLYCERLELAL